MTDKADHIAWAADAIAVYQRHCRTGDEHAIADLICDLGHLAEERGFDFISEVRRVDLVQKEQVRAAAPKSARTAKNLFCSTQGHDDCRCCACHPGLLL